MHRTLLSSVTALSSLILRCENLLRDAVAYIVRRHGRCLIAPNET